MNIKLWIIIAISTLLVENKTDEFSIHFQNPDDEFSIESSFIKSTYWNVYVHDEADKQKMIPINYIISKDGVFKTILLNDVMLNTFVEFDGVNWAKVNKIKLLKDGEGDIKISRNEKDSTIVLTQRRGKLFNDNEKIIIKW